jgi:hypothetical protein
MCRCTPNVRTPFCGKPGCEWPGERSETDTVRMKTIEDWPVDANGAPVEELP